MKQETFFSKRLRKLPERRTLCLLTLLGALDRVRFPGGPQRHQLAAAWLAGSFEGLADVLECLEKTAIDGGTQLDGGRASLRTARWQRYLDRAAGEARKRYASGLRIARWKSISSSEAGCPEILLMRGEIAPVPHWTAVFNSRKGKQTAGDSPWLRAFRAIFSESAFSAGGWVASTGTLSYEMVASHARSIGAPLLTVCPDSLPSRPPSESASASPRRSCMEALLSCHIGGPLCPKRVRLVCRDRFLAALSDRHVAVEIRPEGNLVKVLSDEQTRAPRPLWVFDSPGPSARIGGNNMLIERFPARSRRFSCTAAPGSPLAHNQKPATNPPVVMTVDDCRQQDYLYHFTRACPGPWPGQQRREYHLDLIAGRLGCAHSALDTLCRILEEGRLRASSTMIKGDTAVISWSARSFRDLAVLRKWRPGLIRWTLEPYGLAVTRKTLRRLGAKPAVYLPPALLSRLKPTDRYRYQRHEPPRCAWKQEREWRLAGDLDLTALDPTEAFIMAPDPAAAKEIASRIRCRLPIVVVGPEQSGTSESSSGTP